MQNRSKIIERMANELHFSSKNKCDDQKKSVKKMIHAIKTLNEPQAHNTTVTPY